VPAPDDRHAEGCRRAFAAYASACLIAGPPVRRRVGELGVSRALAHAT
jgi:hypothetical protein